MNAIVPEQLQGRIKGSLGVDRDSQHMRQRGLRQSSSSNVLGSMNVVI